MELTVVHSNELIESSYNLTIDEIRLISFVAAKCDSRKKNIGAMKIYPDEFALAFGLNKQNMHRNLVNSIRSLANKSVTMPIDEKRNAVLPWLGMGIYDRQPNDASHVIVAFSQYIEPYLFELKDRFTAINFECAARLNTPFSFRLYQWLCKAKNLNKARWGGTVTVQLELDWMKTKAGLNNKYIEWRDFSKYAIKPAIDKINANTDLSVIYEPVKTGRKVTAVRFSYVVETEPTFSKPLRPRLFRRPKVVKGSHAEGEWMRVNFEILKDYEKKLKEHDPSAKLSLPDLRKYHQYASLCAPKTAQRLLKEINQRECTPK